MLTFLGLKFSADTILSATFFALFAVSEYIGSNPKLSENSVTQLFLSFVKYMSLGRKEDDKIKQIKDILNKK